MRERVKKIQILPEQFSFEKCHSSLVVREFFFVQLNKINCCSNYIMKVNQSETFKKE